MKFDKELGKERLNNFFGGIGKRVKGLKDSIQEYQDKEPERMAAKIVKMDVEIQLEKRRNLLLKLKSDKQKLSKGNGEILEAFTQQKIFAPESNSIKTKKQKQSDLDTGYSGIGEGMFGG